MDRWLKRYKELSAPVKASLWFTVCSIIQKAISLITVPIFTRILSTEEYGLYTLYLSWHDIIIIFTSLSLGNAVFNKAMLKYKDDRNGLVSSFLGLTTTATLSLFAIVLLFLNSATSFTGLNSAIIYALFFDLLFNPALTFWMAKERFEFRYRRVVFVTLLIAILNPVTGIIAIKLSNYRAEARIFSIVLINSIFGAYLYFIYILKGRKCFDKEYWRYALTFNLPLIPHYLSGMILNQADRIMINDICGASYAGIYGVAYSAAMTITIVINAINASLTPWVYQSLESGKVEKINKVNDDLLILVAGLVFLLMLFGPEAMIVLGGSEYMEAVDVFPFVAGSVYFIFLYCRFADVEFYYEKSKIVLIISVICALLNILLNYIFIRLIGFVAAGITTLVCYAVDSLLHYFTMKWLLKNKSIQLYNYKFIFILSVAMIIICPLVLLLYQHVILRYAVISMLVILALLFSNKIVAAMRSIKK